MHLFFIPNVYNNLCLYFFLCTGLIELFFHFIMKHLWFRFESCCVNKFFSRLHRLPSRDRTCKTDLVITTICLKDAGGSESCSCAQRCKKIITFSLTTSSGWIKNATLCFFKLTFAPPGAFSGSLQGIIALRRLLFAFIKEVELKTRD